MPVVLHKLPLLGKSSLPAVSPERLRDLQAAEILEHIDTLDAHEVVKTLAKGASEARLTREAKAALERLARRQPLTP